MYNVIWVHNEIDNENTLKKKLMNILKEVNHTNQCEVTCCYASCPVLNYIQEEMDVSELQEECPIKIYIGNKSVWPNDHEHYVHFYNSVSLKMTSVFSKYLLGQKKLEIGLCIGFSYSLFAFMFAKSNYYDLFYNEKKYF